MSIRYFCADCRRFFFSLGWHAEACGSGNYKPMPGRDSLLAERDRLREALERIADPRAELQRHKDSVMRGRPGMAALPYEIARKALAPPEGKS